MKAIIFNGCACVLILFAISVTAIEVFCQDVKQDLDTAKLAADYQELHNWREKRAFCIKLIDNDTISRGVRIKNIIEVFGKDARVIKGEQSGECTATVLFEPQFIPRSSGVSKESAPSRAISYEGWYFHVMSLKDGNIANYYLSNLHK